MTTMAIGEHNQMTACLFHVDYLFSVSQNAGIGIWCPVSRRHLCVLWWMAGSVWEGEGFRGVGRCDCILRVAPSYRQQPSCAFQASCTRSKCVCVCTQRTIFSPVCRISIRNSPITIGSWSIKKQDNVQDNCIFFTQAQRELQPSLNISDYQTCKYEWCYCMKEKNIPQNFKRKPFLTVWMAIICFLDRCALAGCSLWLIARVAWMDARFCIKPSGGVKLGWPVSSGFSYCTPFSSSKLCRVSLLPWKIA